MEEIINKDFKAIADSITEKLDNTSTYTGWLMYQEYVDWLIEENTQLKQKNKDEFNDFIKQKEELNNDWLNKNDRLIKQNTQLRKTQDEVKEYIGEHLEMTDKKFNIYQRNARDLSLIGEPLEKIKSMLVGEKE